MNYDVFGAHVPGNYHSWEVLHAVYTERRRTEHTDIAPNYGNSGDIDVLCGVADHDFIAVYQNVGEGDEYGVLLTDRAGDIRRTIGLFIGANTIVLNSGDKSLDTVKRLFHAVEKAVWDDSLTTTHADTIHDAQIDWSLRSMRGIPDSSS